MMFEFVKALSDPQLTFLRYAFLAGLLAGVAFGIIGAFVVARRISSIAGAIAHSVLGGIGGGIFIAYYLNWPWFDPIYGALIAAVISAILIGLVSLYGDQREDTIIGAIWAFGMAIGLLFLDKTPGYHDPMSYLFGNILLITKADLLMIAGLDLIVVVLSLLYYNKLQTVCFDEEFARLRGIRVEVFYLSLLCLTALTVVLMARIVGIVMVIAFLTLPAATAGYFSRLLWHMMLGAMVFSVVFNIVGLGISYTYDLPSGPTNILVAGVIYAAITIGRQLLNKVRKPNLKPEKVGN